MAEMIDAERDVLQARCARERAFPAEMLREIERELDLDESPPARADPALTRWRACSPPSSSPVIPERLYTGLSLLVSAASAGEEARGAARRSARCGALLDPDLEARARAATHVIDAEREPFARTLVELRAAAAELPDCRIWACAAAVQAHGADWATVSSASRA